MPPVHLPYPDTQSTIAPTPRVTAFFDTTSQRDSQKSTTQHPSTHSTLPNGLPSLHITVVREEHHPLAPSLTPRSANPAIEHHQ